MVPLVDFRVLLGKTSTQEDVANFCTLMDQREQDHRNWLNELELSVTEKRSFDLATNPHKCAFGKWYDNFETNDLVLSGLLKKFDDPHKAIHAIAEKVKGFEEEENFEAAYALIEDTKNRGLQDMINLFENVRQAIRDQAKRQVALILEKEDSQVAFSVDSVDSVEEMSPEAMTESSEIFPPDWKNWVAAIGRRTKKDSLALILKSDYFFELTARVEHSEET